MKSLKIPYLSSLNEASAKEASEILSDPAVPFEEIGELNWPHAFEYKPEARFKMARSKDSLFIHFSVEEEYVRATYGKDQAPVWQDSCVEFFCKLPEHAFYRNFEFNCIGTCLACAREGRNENVNPLSEAQLKKIERYASLGNTPFNERKEKTSWQLCVKILFSLLDIDPEKLPEELQANFYKCGDKTTLPHYLSWSRINTEKPDFHRPEFFGSCTF